MQPASIPQSDGSLMPKRDESGRMYQEIRCHNVFEDGTVCNGWLLDAYIREGRIRVRCRRSGCGKITVMVFKPRRSKRRDQKTTNGGPK